MRCKVFCSCYKTYEESIMDVRSRACGFNCYTEIREIEYDRIEDIPDIYLDKFGDDLDKLEKRRHIYLFAEIDKKVIRLTD